MLNQEQKDFLLKLGFKVFSSSTTDFYYLDLSGEKEEADNVIYVFQHMTYNNVKLETANIEGEELKDFVDLYVQVKDKIKELEQNV